MDATLGDPEAISGTTVHAVLTATLDSIKSPLLESRYLDELPPKGSDGELS